MRQQVVATSQRVGEPPAINHPPRRKTMKNRKNAGHLIELLIVVAIIGILPLSLSRSSAYRQKAYNAAAQSDLKNLKTGMEAYMSDNQSYPTELVLNP
jgi:type IV pilus assembly protein PilA